MADYQVVEKALAEGADPAMLCATCPWDRLCITPPTKTKDDVDAEIAKAKTKDKEDADAALARGETGAMPVGTLITAVVFAGKHLSATLCPVLALRLRSSAGKKIADDMRTTMTGWDDQA